MTMVMEMDEVWNWLGSPGILFGRYNRQTGRGRRDSSLETQIGMAA